MKWVQGISNDNATKPAQMRMQPSNVQPSGSQGQLAANVKRQVQLGRRHVQKIGMEEYLVFGGRACARIERDVGSHGGGLHAFGVAARDDTAQFQCLLTPDTRA